jgi:hypothetical protein
MCYGAPEWFRLHTASHRQLATDDNWPLVFILIWHLSLVAKSRHLPWRTTVTMPTATRAGAPSWMTSAAVWATPFGSPFSFSRLRQIGKPGRLRRCALSMLPNLGMSRGASFQCLIWLGPISGGAHYCGTVQPRWNDSGCNDIRPFTIHSVSPQGLYGK